MPGTVCQASWATGGGGLPSGGMMTRGTPKRSDAGHMPVGLAKEGLLFLTIYSKGIRPTVRVA